MINEIISLLNENKDYEQSIKMSAYMQDKFTFAGIPKPKLSELIKPFLKEHSKEALNWDFVLGLWQCDYRETQYIAIEYLNKHKKQIEPCDIDKLKHLITTKSWWETVDSIDAFVGDIVIKDEGLKAEIYKWAEDENIWLRRVAIDFQQRYKDKTYTEMLAKIIKANLGSDEFFINKAIGWSLREYSKTNPEWVLSFVEEHRDKMAKLSIKEATKLL